MVQIDFAFLTQGISKQGEGFLQKKYLSGMKNPQP
jgi:hypothetical protein